MNDFLYLMQQVMYFVNYKWTIWGFTFSFIDVWFYIALCELCFAFIWQIFGQIPRSIHSSAEQNYNGSGQNNYGKAGNKHYGNRKQG